MFIINAWIELQQESNKATKIIDKNTPQTPADELPLIPLQPEVCISASLAVRQKEAGFLLFWIVPY